MQNVIILKKKSKNKKLSTSIEETTMSAEVVQALSPFDFIRKYKRTINNIDIDKANELGLTVIINY